jgi:hypothetical protein
VDHEDALRGPPLKRFSSGGGGLDERAEGMQGGPAAAGAPIARVGDDQIAGLPRERTAAQPLADLPLEAVCLAGARSSEDDSRPPGMSPGKGGGIGLARLLCEFRYPGGPLGFGGFTHKVSLPVTKAG